MKRATLLLMLILSGSFTLLPGCAATPPNIQEYLLRTEPPVSPGVARTNDKGNVILKPIWVAPYLDRRGIVVETASNQLTEARYQIWAEPLTTALRRVLQVTIGQSTERSVRVDHVAEDALSVAVDVQIFRFHGDLDGNVTLVAEWILSAAGSTGTRYQFSRSQRTSTEGYDGLVDTYLQLANQLGNTIGDSIKRFPQPGR